MAPNEPETSVNRTAHDIAVPKGHSLADLKPALHALEAGGVVAIPTDTLFGLAADTSNEVALERIFDIKGRPASLALPVLVSDWEQAAMVSDRFHGPVRQLAASFWPGCLTLVLPKAASLSPLITGGRDSVAVRMPDHWVPLGLASLLGRPITGTSANRSGQADLESAAQVRETLGDSVDLVIELGPEPRGLQSTIVDLTSVFPVLLREGVAPFEDVLKTWQAVMNSTAATNAGGASLP